MPSINLRDLFREELGEGINVFTGGRDVVNVERLTREEEDAVLMCVRMVERQLALISPSLAADWRKHESAWLKWAAVAKGLFPEKKPVSFPSEPGKIGVAPLFPQAIKYAASPSDTAPCYTNYETNKWTIPLTAGTAAWILGDGSHYYKASPQTNKHAMLVVMQDGVIEVGTTPSAQQFRIVTEIYSRYGIYVANPLVDNTIEHGKLIYRYPTPGMIPVYHDLGIMWGFMPTRDGKADIRLLGLVFYEHDLFPTVTWIA